jgi:Flp pilus assembly protein TadG
VYFRTIIPRLIGSSRPTRHPPPTTLHSPRRGIAAAELAILLPFLALMFIAAVDFCRVYYCTQTVQDCARSAAFYASGTSRRDPSTTTLEQAAKDAAIAGGQSLSPPLANSDVAVTIDNASATVTITYSFPLFTNYFVVPNPIVIRRTVTMANALRSPGEPE